MDDQEMIDIVMEYGAGHSNFDTSFAESLQEKLDEYGSLTEGQRTALDNIIEKFRMCE